ncbi:MULTISPECIES: hypothetical protein [Bacillaceae]|uniref:Uncharacterized protein n=2 Tax=Bacillus subtilis subsp. subtilis TaxID=135461 RepID=A0A2K4Z9I8_BACSU|nr:MULTISPECIES: hypothetical protein [Bacillales]YP_009513962.1 hypothetical protein BSU_18595 [Bacillus subtilis subsp. subtilis str. 168]MBA4562655.1 hypothetical protein [Bacillus subtilis subsp. subtilis]MBA5240299.1 hypothetical protein [Bacillus subtilis subsp. subtilis]MBE7403251.1 hypothetical protein [Bacillus subtilis]MBE7409775.1 hypothetical protein [Bacillus subtilis]MBF8202610.1 hypothetical protein [Bacillus subtilis]
MHFFHSRFGQSGEAFSASVLSNKRTSFLKPFISALRIAR